MAFERFDNRATDGNQLTKVGLDALIATPARTVAERQGLERSVGRVVGFFGIDKAVPVPELSPEEAAEGDPGSVEEPIIVEEPPYSVWAD